MCLIISGFSDEISPDFDEQLSTVKQLGMNYISLRNADGKNIAEYSVDEAKEKLLPRLQSAGVSVSSIGSPIGKVDINDPEGYAKQLAQLGNLCQMCKLFDCAYIRVFSFFVPHGEHGLYRDEVIKRMKRFSEIASAYDVTLIHENEKDIYGETGERCLDIMESVNSTYLKLAFDFANFVQCGEDPVECWALLKDHVAYIHIKDAIRASKENVLCGTGEGRISEILKQAVEGGYKGFLTLEPHLVLFSGLQALEKEDANDIIKQNKAPDGATGYKMQYEALMNILNAL